MVSRVEALYRLQLIDTETAETKQALADIESQSEESEGLVYARRKLAEGEEALRELRGELRGLELDLKEIASKIEATQEVLYGGRITNPKELAGLEQELDYLERRQSDVEDETLERMAEVEEKEESLVETRVDLERMEREWEARRDELRQRAEELRSRLTSLQRERERALLEVSEGDLSIYLDLRRRKGGEAIALVEDGICQGCRVALPTGLVQKVHRGEDLVYCGSCRRILHSLS